MVLLMRGEAVLHEGHGNLLEADAEALVNTVNTVGVIIAFRHLHAGDAEIDGRQQRHEANSFTVERGDAGHAFFVCDQNDQVIEAIAIDVERSNVSDTAGDEDVCRGNELTTATVDDRHRAEASICGCNITRAVTVEVAATQRHNRRALDGHLTG